MDEADCDHDTTYGGLCVGCGKDVSATSNKKKKKLQPIVLGGKKLMLTRSAIKRQAKLNDNDLLLRRKLLLILDIDHTFAHSTVNPQAYQVVESEKFKGSTFRFKLRNHPNEHFVKIRPHFKEFLQEVSKSFDVHVYTHAIREYAEEIVKRVDPEVPVIKNRIVCRDDFRASEGKKKVISRLFPCDESMAIILDDLRDVWFSPSNVLQIHKYAFWLDCEVNGYTAAGAIPIIPQPLGVLQVHLQKPLSPQEWTHFQAHFHEYFKTHRVVTMNGAGTVVNIQTARAPTELNMREVAAHFEKYQKQIPYLKGAFARYEVNWPELERREGDEVLKAMTPVLLKIHEHYYNENIKGPKDVRSILAQIASEVFRGLRFLFTGVFRDNDPRRAEVERSAKWFGADIAQTITPGNKEKVTHIICSRGKTTKVRIAQNEPGLKIVHVNWMYNSMVHFVRSEEDLYQMFPKAEKYISAQLLKKSSNKLQSEAKALPEAMNIETVQGESQSSESSGQMSVDLEKSLDIIKQTSLVSETIGKQDL